MRKSLSLAIALGCSFVAAPFVAAEELIISSRSHGETLDVHSYGSTYAGFDIWRVYEPLAERDNTGSMAPKLLKSFTPVDSKTWRMVIRNDVTFSNGQPMTMDDVLFSIERQREGPWGWIQADWDTVTRIDDQTFEVTLKNTDALFPATLSIGVMSKQWSEEHNVTEALDTNAAETPYTYNHAMGTGPFMLKERVQDEKTIMVKNPNYWNKADPLLGNITQYTYTPIGAETTASQALEAGQIHWRNFLTSRDADKFKALDGFKVEKANLGGFYHFYVNFKEDDLVGQPGSGNPLRNRAVRKAIQLAMDSDGLVKKVYGGYARVSSAPAMPGNTGWDASLDQAPYKNEYNPEKAKQLLQEAGVKDMTLTVVCPNDKEREAICLYTVGALKKIGINVNPKVVSFQQALTARNKAEYDLLLMGMGNGIESWGQIARFQCDNATNLKAFGYCNPEFDRLVKLSKSTMDEQQRRKYLVQAMQLFATDFPRIELISKEDLTAMKDNITFPEHYNNNPNFNQYTVN